MGKKKVKALLKLQIPAGQASPAPPVGPALGQHGVNIMDFVKEHVATYKQIRMVEFIDEIPKSPSGKILRRFLRASG